MPVEIKERQVGSVTVLEVRGRMVLDQSDVLGKQLDRLISGGQVHLLLECSEVSDIDSHGMGVLVRGLTSAVKRGGTLKLLKPSPRLRENLALLGLPRAAESFDDEATALASFR